MAEAEDPTELRARHKVIATLLPYAIWQERIGKPGMLTAFLHAATASRMSELMFMWRHVDDLIPTQLHEATPRAIILVSSRVPWHLMTSGDGSIQLWIAATSAVQVTEEVAQCVVSTLLWIASNGELLQHITVDVWSWLTKRPYLPHLFGALLRISPASCQGSPGSQGHRNSRVVLPSRLV